MGEARRRRMAETNGHVVTPRFKRVRLVHDVRLENHEGAVILMLGDRVPELGCPFTPDEARRLIEALEKHLRGLESARIIIPGTGGPHA